MDGRLVKFPNTKTVFIVVLYIHFSVRYLSDEGAKENIQEQKKINSQAVGKTKPDVPYVMATKGSQTFYQQLTSSTMKGDYENMLKKGADRGGKPRSQPEQVTLDGQIYDTCT